MDDIFIQPELGPSEEPSENESSLDPDSDNDFEAASIKSTRSCSTENLQPTLENGRRYADDSYFMPNDESELTRLNIVHQIYLILLDGNLTTAPLNTPRPRILDIGTGPGDWAIKMSAKHPTAEIIASDLGVFDSGLGHLSLPNVDFQLADAQSQWTYHEPFDLIHIRGLSGAFNDWHNIYTQALSHLKPGGYIEVADVDPAGDTITMPSDLETSHLRTYAAALRAAADEAGYPRDLKHLATTALSEAGFVDVRVQERSIPIGLWPEDVREKTLGKMGLIVLLEGLEAYALRTLTRSGRWSLDEATELCEKVRGECVSATGLVARVRIVTGKKPVSFAQRREEVMARTMARIKALNADGLEEK
ncbi:hypothetical protein N7448_005592 [Penicillium atrosanguineum]|nr:hypothetical protein N7448_005592 [Penicillium atrosanguineum]